VENLNIHCLVFLQTFLGLSNSTAILLMQLLNWREQLFSDEWKERKKESYEDKGR